MTEMMRMASRLFEGNGIAPIQEPAAPREEQEGEVIDGRDVVTYILHSPGHNKDDFRVSVTPDEVEVKTTEFLKRAPLPAKVDPDSATSSYVNGILSVRVKKR